ncbi:EAL domain-containing protein [Xylophilus rhododendri]|uniref:EAL domain-containing protein n=1 Tax=Xylophilus rhododendri TaxID=2697032 RepID=A0A857JAC2_9BURK|nr:phosphodiesterase [Xylophilus rhododendri]QHI99932.1 EAL domain-containing protein [Xylophilus rhododendri]
MSDAVLTPPRPALCGPHDARPTRQPTGRTSARRADFRALARLLRYRKLHAVFQPIADLDSGAVLGHEALIRGPAGTSLHTPDALLALAQRLGMLPGFELYCAVTALQDWSRHGVGGKLFVNMGADALVLALRRHGRDELLSQLRACGIAPHDLVVEITEHQRASDVPALRKAAAELRDCGIDLALDDFGDGHSSLRLWHELRPAWVKMDKYFTSLLQQPPAAGAQSNADAQQVVQAIKGIAELFGSTLIAEGIETEQGLRAVQELRISCGQGYLLGRPHATPRAALESPARETVQREAVALLPPRSPRRPGGHTVLRRLPVLHAPAVGLVTTNNELAQIFQRHPELHAVAVVAEGRPVAVVNRQHFMNHYSTLYFREVHGRKPCVGFANHKPRVVEMDYDVDDLVGILTSPDQRYLSEGFIVTEGGRYLGLGTGDQLVRAVTEARVEAARHANPLTFLPGNIPINLHIERLLDSGVEFVACHADLNDFKPFNDHYGYWRGDQMIRLCARLAVSHCDARRDFVGHIGGDDFMVLFQSGDWQQRCERIVGDFDLQALDLFNEDARITGGIHGRDRHGQERFFPCTTLSIGAVRVRRGDFRHADEVASSAALAKHDAKLSRRGLHVGGPPSN